MWDQPLWAHFLERLASCSRLIPFDMRGVGISDRGAEPPTIELQRDDIAAVMDAVGIEQAVVFGGARAAAMAMLFAATHPQRTKALILYAPVAKTIATADFPAGDAGPSEILVSQTVKDLTAGSGLAFADAGEHELKGVPERWRLYRVESAAGSGTQPPS